MLASAHLRLESAIFLSCVWVCVCLSACQILHREAHSGVCPLMIMLEVSEVSVGRILIEELEDGERLNEGVDIKSSKRKETEGK